MRSSFAFVDQSNSQPGIARAMPSSVVMSAWLMPLVTVQAVDEECTKAEKLVCIPIIVPSKPISGSAVITIAGTVVIFGRCVNWLAGAERRI